MGPTIQTAKRLKDFLETLSQRSDLHFTYREIRPAASQESVNEAKDDLPQSLLDFYSVMNGCDIYAAFKNNTRLSLGMRIPPIERIGKFRYPPKDEYNFPPGFKFMPLEWIEPEFAFYYLLAEEDDISEAKIVVAPSAEESRYITVAATMDEFIEKALECSLASGWGYKYFGREYLNEIKQIIGLLQAPAEKTKLLESGARVRMFNPEERGTVVKQVKTEGSHRYYGNEFVLVDFDLAGKFWVRLGEVKKVPGKKDVYETAVANPEEFMKSLLDGEPEEAARTLFRIGSDCSYYRGFNEVEGLRIPDFSYRYAAIFCKLPFDKAIKGLTDLFAKLTVAAAGRLKKTLAFVPNGTEFNKKENERPFYFPDVLSTLLGCLILLYMIKKKQEPDYTFSADLQADLSKSFEKLIRSPDFPTNGGFPTPFKENMDVFPQLLQASLTKAAIVCCTTEGEGWVEELGLGKSFAFRLN